jgi:hypothetical protein
MSNHYLIVMDQGEVSRPTFWLWKGSTASSREFNLCSPSVPRLKVHCLTHPSAALPHPKLSTSQGITDSNASCACCQLMVALISVFMHTSKEMNRHLKSKPGI